MGFIYRLSLYRRSFFCLPYSLGEIEEYKTPKWAKGALMVSVFFIIIVLTNDIHGWVFVLNSEYSQGSDDFLYNWIYYIIYGWIIFITIGGLRNLFRKQKRKSIIKLRMLPFIPIILMILYSVFYARKSFLIKYFLGDMTTFYCVMFMVLVESCIFIKLIPTNTNYKDLFMMSAVPLLITDKSIEKYVSSDLFPDFREIDLERIAQESVIINDFRVSCLPLKGGYVYWKENLTDLFNIFNELEELKEELEDTNEMLRTEYLIELRKKQVETLNSLYDQMREETKDQISLLSKKIEEMERVTDRRERKYLVEEILLLGAYLKRRNSLILISQGNDWISSRELFLSINEITECLEIVGVECSVKVEIEEVIQKDHFILFYDFIEKIIEDSIRSLDVFMIRIFIKENLLSLMVCIECEEIFPEGESILLNNRGSIKVTKDEDDTWKFEITIDIEGGK